jgi:hypothetical protein
MKRPAFQFYPGDWKTNANLRRCSWAARGVWIEIMGLMHDSDTYGVLYWPLKEIAQAVGCPVALVREIADKGVMRGSDRGAVEGFIYTPRSGRQDGEPVELVPASTGPIWYSSRMVRDEYVRSRLGVGSRFGSAKNGDENGDKPAPEPSPTRRKGEGQGGVKSDGASSSSSSSVSTSKPSKLPLEPPGAGADGDPPGDDFGAVCAAAGLVPTARKLAAERAIFEGWTAGWPWLDVGRDIVPLIGAELRRRKGPTSSLERFARVVTDAKARAVAAAAVKGACGAVDHSGEGGAEAEFRRAVGMVLSEGERRCSVDLCRLEARPGVMVLWAKSAFAAEHLGNQFGAQIRAVGKGQGVAVVIEVERGEG